VAGLRDLETSETHIEIGAAVPIADAMPAIVSHYPQLEELFLRFASPPIRNAGTLGGNIANGSPIGDSMPVLMVAGTTLLLRTENEQRELNLDEFYLDYMVNALGPGEFIERIRIPLPVPGAVLHSDKLSKRFDQDISAVCTAYRLELDGGVVKSFAMACGGLAATVKRAVNCEAAVVGRRWDPATIEAARAALAKDFTPISDMRATAGYRLRATGNLLQRFYLQTTGAPDSSVYGFGRND
jgi:xanthine dehydrogenase small subunit